MSKPKETETTFTKWRAAVKAAETLLGEIKDLPADQVTAAQHAAVDKVLDEATALRLEVDKERSVAGLKLVAAQRGELNEAARWIQARGLVPVEGEEDTDVYSQIHKYAKELFDGVRASASLKIDLTAVQTQNALLNSGVTGQDMVRAAESGFTFGPTGQPVRAALGLTSGIVPDTWSTTFYDYMEFMGGLRRAGAAVTPMNRGNTMTFYRNTAHNTTTGATTEAAAAAATEDTYGSYEISTAMYTGLAYLSRQLIEDAGPTGLMGIVDTGLSRVIARKSETAYHTAFSTYDSTDTAKSYDRTTKSVTDSKLGNPEITRKMILDLLFGLDEGYLSMPSVNWLCRAMTYRHILEITYGSSDLGLVYEPSPVAGAPDMVEGHPIYYDAFLPAIVAAADTTVDQIAMAIGQFADAFHIMDVGGVQMDMSREYKFAEQQVTVLGSFRTGASIKDPRAARLAMTKQS